MERFFAVTRTCNSRQAPPGFETHEILTDLALGCVECPEEGKRILVRSSHAQEAVRKVMENLGRFCNRECSLCGAKVSASSGLSVNTTSSFIFDNAQFRGEPTLE